MAEFETWYLKRHKKSDEISPGDIAQNIERHFITMLDGCIWLWKEPFIPGLPLNQRNYFGSRENHAQSGRYTYNVLVIIDEVTKREGRDIIVKPNRWRGGNPAPLNEITGTTEYSGITIPPHWIEKILPYTLVHAGVTNEQEPLTQVFKGEKVNEFIRV